MDMENNALACLKDVVPPNKNNIKLINSTGVKAIASQNAARAAVPQSLWQSMHL